MKAELALPCGHHVLAEGDDEASLVKDINRAVNDHVGVESFDFTTLQEWWDTCATSGIEMVLFEEESLIEEYFRLTQNLDEEEVAILMITYAYLLGVKLGSDEQLEPSIPVVGVDIEGLEELFQFVVEKGAKVGAVMKAEAADSAIPMFDRVLAEERFQRMSPHYARELH